MAKRIKVNVSEMLWWECPCCNKEHYEEPYLRRGDPLDCQCGFKGVLDEQYASCRPPSMKPPKQASH